MIEPGGAVEVSVLGPLEVRTTSGPVDAGTPKQRAVLAMLALHPGRVVAVERILDELWPDDPPARALSSLHAYVSRLRRALSAAGADGVLVSRAPGYLLDVAPDGVDAVRVARHADRGRALLAAGSAAEALAEFDAALALWRGSPLPDLALGAFGQAERTRLEEVRLALVEGRVTALLALGRSVDAVQDAESALAGAPYREQLWADLMLALYRCGRQGDALAAYQRARDRLDEDLGIDPGPRLQELHAAVLRQDPSLAAPVPATAAPSPATTSAATTSAAPAAAAGCPAGGPDDELIGRADEVAVLDAALAGALAGSGSLLLVSGAAGIGKSAVLDALARRAAAAGAVVARGVAVDCAPPPAYLPWVQVLRELVREAGVEAVTTAFAPHGNIPAVLDPAFGELLPLPPVERVADAELARTRIFQGAVDGLHRLGRQRPVVVVIDDAQWLDAASVLLAQLLAAGIADAPVVIALGFRDLELAGDAPFAQALGALAASPTARRLALSGLRTAAVAELAAHVAGEPVPDDVVAVIEARTGGNPFFVRELVRVLVGEHAVHDAAVAGAHVPARVQEVVRRRLARLPEQVNAVLSVAAVLGRRFSVDVLQRIVTLDGDALFDVVDTALVTGVLDEGDHTQQLRFTHDLMRETIYGDLRPLRRAQLHAKAVEALAALPDADAGELAHHVGRAVPVVQPLRAVGHVVAAAADAYARMAYEQADELHAAALRLLAEAPAGEERDRAELDVRVRIAYMHQSTDGYLAPAVVAQYEVMPPLLDRVHLDEETLPALWGWASYSHAQGRFDDASSIGRRALARGNHEPWALVTAHTHEGLAAWDSGDLVAAREATTRALAALPEGEVRVFPVVGWDAGIGVLCVAAAVAALVDEADECGRLLDAAQARAAVCGTDFAEIYVLNYRAFAATDLRRPEQALDPARRSLAIAERRGYPEYALLARVTTGWALARHGDPAGLEMSARSFAGADPGEVRWHRVAALHADALLAFDRVEEAAALTDRALARPASGRGLFGVADLHLSRSRARAALGDRDGALADARAAVESAERLHSLTARRRARDHLAALTG